MVTLEGNKVGIGGIIPEKGQQVPDFTLVNGNLAEMSLEDYRGKRIILNIFPSIDTDVCAQSVREFEKRALEEDNVVVIGISKDLPFAQKRFCLNQNIEKVHTLSGFRNSSFGKDFGVDILDSPIAGLYGRAVVVSDEQGVVLHSELVSEITKEPDYEAALKVLKN